MPYDISLVSAESTRLNRYSKNVHVTVKTAPGAWIKITDKSGRNELRQVVKPTRGTW